MLLASEVASTCAPITAFKDSDPLLNGTALKLALCLRLRSSATKWGVLPEPAVEKFSHLPFETFEPNLLGSYKASSQAR